MKKQCFCLECLALDDESDVRWSSEHSMCVSISQVYLRGVQVFMNCCIVLHLKPGSCILFEWPPNSSVSLCVPVCVCRGESASDPCYQGRAECSWWMWSVDGSGLSPCPLVQILTIMLWQHTVTERGRHGVKVSTERAGLKDTSALNSTHILVTNRHQNTHSLKNNHVFIRTLKHLACLVPHQKNITRVRQKTIWANSLTQE